MVVILILILIRWHSEELLDSVSKPKVGMEWWVIRDAAAMATEFAESDPRRFWLKGEVARIDAEDSSMAVRLTPDHSAGAGASAGPGASAGAGAGAGAGAASHTVIVKFGGGLFFRRAEELLHDAQQNMRCVTWSAITLALLENNTNTHGAEQEKSAYSISQSVDPATKIDFFISHRQVFFLFSELVKLNT